jgi:hypothetical protein
MTPSRCASLRERVQLTEHMRYLLPVVDEVVLDDDVGVPIEDDAVVVSNVTVSVGDTVEASATANMEIKIFTSVEEMKSLHDAGPKSL